MFIQSGFSLLKKDRRAPISIWIDSNHCYFTIEDAKKIVDNLNKSIAGAIAQEEKWCVEDIERKMK